MQVFFKYEFVNMFNKMPRNDQRRAKPFVAQVWKDLKLVPGPNVFQTLPYRIAMETNSKLNRYLKQRNIQLDKDDVIFSLVGNGFVILFAVNTNNLSILEIWSIKPIKHLKP